MYAPIRHIFYKRVLRVLFGEWHPVVVVFAFGAALAWRLHLWLVLVGVHFVFRRTVEMSGGE